MTGAQGRHGTLGSVMGNAETNTGRRSGGWRLRAVLLAIALAGAVPVCARTISDDTDRISGERTVAYTADGSTDLARPVFTFNASFVGEVSTSAINLAFVSRSEGEGRLRRDSRVATASNGSWMARRWRQHPPRIGATSSMAR